MKGCFAQLGRGPYQVGIFRVSLRKPICYSTSETDSARWLDIRTLNKRISELIRMDRLCEARSLFDAMPQKNTITWNSMMNGYVKNKEILKARKLFDEMSQRDRNVVSWNLMIKGYVSCRGCGMRYFEEGRRLFDQMPVRDLVSWNTMISGYSRVGRMDDALRLFDNMPERDVVTWNAMMTGFLQNGNADRAIELFTKMPGKDASSLSALISGLIRTNKLDKAKEILMLCRECTSSHSDLVPGYNTLIAGYGQKGRVDEARALFDQMLHFPRVGTGGSMRFERNLVSWNAMIMGYVKVGDVISARELFDQMVERDIFSWNTMISGCVQVLDMEQAEKLFSHMPYPDTMSWNMMVSGYAQSGKLQTALNFFDRTPQKSLISWNSIIAGCDKNGEYEIAVKFFMQMLGEDVKPDRHTLSSILSVCTGLSALDFGRLIHQLVNKTLVADIPINNSLVTMYSRCGAITEARTMFNEMGMKSDVITWNTMIGGYASHGHAMTAIELFEEMKRKRVQPTFITFISVLNACAHAGLLDEGRKYFASMVSDFGIEPRTEHYAALVDIVGRHGHLREAMDLINNMPYTPDKAIWGALLGACRIHNNIEFARVASEALSKLEPESSASYVLLHNAFADLKQWEAAQEVRNVMELNDVRKERASSWVDCVSHV